MKNRYIILWVNLVLISVVFVLNYFYQKADFDFTLKCICSFCFALLAVINMVCALLADCTNKSFCISMSLGVILSFFGDVLIGYNFIAGAATFAVGHILFIVAYSFLHKFIKRDILIGAILFVGSGAFLLFYPFFNFGSDVIMTVCLIYALIISMMLAKSLGNFILDKSLFTTIIAFASLLFFFSDLMLVLGKFADFGKWASKACMGTYYPALCLLSFSVIFNEIKQNK